MADQRSSKEMPPLPPMLREHNPPTDGDRAQLYTSDQMYAYGRECVEWERLRASRGVALPRSSQQERARQLAEDWHEGVPKAQQHAWACRAAGLLLHFADGVSVLPQQTDPPPNADDGDPVGEGIGHV